MTENLRKILTGMKEICQYAGMSEDLVRLLIRNYKFPARRTGQDAGTWISNSAAIDEWSIEFSRSGILVNPKEADS